MINGLPFYFVQSLKAAYRDDGAFKIVVRLLKTMGFLLPQWPRKVQVIIIFVQIFSTSKTAFQDTPILWPHTMTQSTSYQSFKHVLNDFICSLPRGEDRLGESVHRYPNFRLFLYYYRGFPIETWNVHDMLVHHNSTLEIHLYNWWIINLNMVLAFIDGR